MSQTAEHEGRPIGRASQTGAFRQRTALSLLVVLATCALFLAGALDPLENRLISLRAQALDKSPSGEVAIVEIDARSLAELSTWPWSRQLHAEAVNRLHDAGAEMIAFDVDFSAVSEPVGDREFAEALRRAESVILPIFQQRASDQSGKDIVIKSRPAPIFDAAWVGGVNIFPDPDGVVREYPAATVIDGEIHPSISGLLAENDDLADRSFQPDWGIDAQRIPRFSFVDIVKGRTPHQAISGKRILIGATAVELGDRYVVPRFGTVPGVVVQALAAESLLQGRALTRTGPLLTIAGIIVIAMALGIGGFARFNRTFPAAAIAIVSLLAIGPLVIQAKMPYSIDTAALWFASLACVVLRVTVEMRRRVALKAQSDDDTDLPNRLALEADLAKLDSLAPVVATAAIERFDSIRDAIGIAGVSDLVRLTGARIGAKIGAKVYRIAPDILGWVQPGENDTVVGAAILEITELFREPVRTQAGSVDVRLTIGLDRDSHTSGAVAKIERALAAISAARAAGDVCHWFQGSDPAVRRELSLMGELRRAMAAGDVTIAYQPKLDFRTGRITHAEALVRWHHPTEGCIAPDRFVPLAESTGVICELTDFVLRTVIADCARLSSMGREMCAAVNVSAADLAAPNFAEKVESMLAEHRCEACNIAIEVTESAIIRSTADAISVLTDLRKLGVRLSVDDYGTGQSTLSYLKQLPVHELKIDKSFVTSICDNSNDQIMVRSTIQLAHELGLEVVAEGVEDAATACLLERLRCDFAQGYFIGRPMAFDELCDAQSQARPAKASATRT